MKPKTRENLGNASFNSNLLDLIYEKKSVSEAA